MDKFWLTTPMEKMSHEQWESLCDGCGKCCQVQFLDEEEAMLMQTDVACPLLDIETVRCTNYQDRLKLAPDCMQITPETLDNYFWLPDSCAYKVVARGEDLPSWHHLVSGDPQLIHKLGKSVQGKLINESQLTPQEVEDHIIAWMAITD